MDILFPPCGGRMRSLSERSELRRSWMGGAAARTAETVHLCDLDSCRPSCGGTPHPNLPPQGGKEFAFGGAAGREALPPRIDRHPPLQRHLGVVGLRLV